MIMVKRVDSIVGSLLPIRLSTFKLVKFVELIDLFKGILPLFDYFPPVVSRELMPPHKMAEIRPNTCSKEGVWA